jgi:predicted DNA-binding transcriptional regulator AlpA
VLFGMGQSSKITETKELLAIGTEGQANHIWPPVLTRPEGAKMCGISVQTFDTWVRKGVLPGPIAGTRRWSRSAMEQRLAGQIATPSTTEQPSAFEQWKRGHAH